MTSCSYSVERDFNAQKPISIRPTPPVLDSLRDALSPSARPPKQPPPGGVEDKSGRFLVFF